jgi:predicted N-acetyltransferase YhbS
VLNAVLFILGQYYPRFGFSAELARKLALPFPGEAFMALELGVRVRCVTRRRSGSPEGRGHGLSLVRTGGPNR